MFPLNMLVLFFVCKCPRTLVSAVSLWPPCCISPLAYLSHQTASKEFNIKEPPEAHGGNYYNHKKTPYRNESLKWNFSCKRHDGNGALLKLNVVTPFGNRPSPCLLGPFANFPLFPTPQLYIGVIFEPMMPFKMGIKNNIVPFD